MSTDIALIDTHCHLDFSEFDEDRQHILESCVAHGISTIIIPGTTSSRWQRLAELQSQHELLKIALGIHPHFLHEEVDVTAALSALDSLLGSGMAIAVGEIGMDGKVDNLSWQREVFASQLMLAEKHALPAIVHLRAAVDQVYSEIKRFKGPALIWHAFSGSTQLGLQFIEAGCYLGVGGVITYERAAKTRRAIAELPLERLLLETDAPDMPLSGRQGERNSPVFLGEVFSVLCTLRSESPAQIRSQLCENTQRAFSIDKI